MNDTPAYPAEMMLPLTEDGPREFGASPQLAPAPAESASAIREYLGILMRRRWVIIGIVAMALLAGLAATMLATPQYTASSRIEINRNQQRITDVEGVDQADRTFDQEFYETQYELLKARSVAERVVRRLRLPNNLDFFLAHGIDAENAPYLSSGDRAPTREELAQRQEAATSLLLGHIAIAPVARSSIVDINYSSGSPAMSAMIANTWAEQFIQASIDRRFESTADARNFLERRLGELRSQVEASERRLVEYANANDIVILERVQQDGRTVSSPTLASNNLQAMNDALVEATARRIEIEAAAANANSAVATNTAIANLRNRRAELSARYSEMMVQFEPGYPAARALQEQIAELDNSIAREEARIRGGAQSEYRAALQREQALRSRVDGLTNGLRTQERARIQYNIYQNEVDTNRALYEGVLQRYREIGVAGVGASNISLVDHAQTPGLPSSPNLLLNMAVALLAGLALAGVAVFALEQLDDGIREPGEIAPLLGLPALGAIPEAVGDEEAIELVMDPKSELSEAYLTVRSNLAFSSQHGVPRSFMVTSSRPAEGKSTSSFAIATVLARTGKRVVLLDADMRSPSMHEMFDLPNDAGFSNYLTGNDDVRSMLVPTATPNLTLMAAGRTPPSAAELLSSDRTRNLIETLTRQFDHVVVDSPPLLGLADATLIARAVEGVVYVIEARGVSTRGLKMSLARLRESRAHLLGAILTKFGGYGATGYGYGYGYGYGLKYGHRDEESA